MEIFGEVGGGGGVGVVGDEGSEVFCDFLRCAVVEAGLASSLPLLVRGAVLASRGHGRAHAGGGEAGEGEDGGGQHLGYYYGMVFFGGDVW